jgi:hypothetical protein
VENLPGGNLVRDGLRDLADQRTTEAALLVSIAAPRLRMLGIDVPPTMPNPEEGLWELLALTNADSAHSRYNALVQRVVSFERALACAA